MKRTKAEVSIMKRYLYMQHPEERELWKILVDEWRLCNISQLIRECVRLCERIADDVEDFNPIEYGVEKNE